jgi:hypothetical protein
MERTGIRTKVSIAAVRLTKVFISNISPFVDFQETMNGGRSRAGRYRRFIVTRGVEELILRLVY